MATSNAKSHVAISTSSDPNRNTDTPGFESPMSPVSPSPFANTSGGRRRSTVADDSNVWTHHANGEANVLGNIGGQTSSSADGVAFSSRLGNGSEWDASKLERISDADPHGDDMQLTDDEETGLTEAARKRRQQRKQTASSLDEQVAPSGLLAIPASADVTVLRRSLINVGLIGLWYFFSLSISIYNKWMFGPDHLDFKFPLFTTSVHMLVQFSLASLVLYIFPRFRPHGESNVEAVSPPAAQTFRGMFAIVTRWFYLTRLGPCGAATGLDIGLGNMSLKFITLTFFTMCKSSALAFVLLFAFVFRLESPSVKLVLIIATMTGGVVMMVFGEVNFDLRGFVLIILSSFFSGFRWSLTQILLLRHPATSNPFASIFFLTPIMFATLLLLAIPVETFPALGHGLAELVAKKGIVLGPLLLLFPGMLAFCMTAAEYALLQRTSVVTLSICGIFKEVVTISAAEIVYHDPLTPINLSGLVVTICAIAAYNYLKIQKMRRDAAESLAAAHGSGADATQEERRGMLAPEEELEVDDDREPPRSRSVS